MKLLVLGGTIFLGRHVVEAALARGHEVTLFNRGRQGAHLFPALEKLRGDRGGDLGALRGRAWDAVVDPSGFGPAEVAATARLLGDAVGHYAFVSSISAYAEGMPRGFDESWPLAAGDEGYGARKARCEEALAAAMPGRALIVRPGVLAGPHDPTDRFTYWPRRVAAGGDVLAPGRPERQVQLLDARDLAAWILDMAESRRVGAFTTAGPGAELGMGALLEACRAETGSDARLVWIDDATLAAAGVEPWTELPLWIPEVDSPTRWFLAADPSRAIAAGLRLRPLRETIRDTLAWDRREGAQPTERKVRVVPITRERETEVLRGSRS